MARLAELVRVLKGDPHAPTAIRDEQRVLDDHLADSLVALELDLNWSGRQVVDVGSGAGLPALPLAIARPQAHFVALESVARKARFIERAATECALDNVEVVNSRAESWPEGLARFDLVLVRAVATLAVVLEYAAPLLAVGGSLVAWRGGRDLGAEAAAARAATALGMRVGDIRHVQPFPGARDRHLHLFSKVRDTPTDFPRRSGMAAKRPLGAG